MSRLVIKRELIHQHPEIFTSSDQLKMILEYNELNIKLNSLPKIIQSTHKAQL
jgi:hypothetical protein